MKPNLYFILVSAISILVAGCEVLREQSGSTPGSNYGRSGSLDKPTSSRSSASRFHEALACKDFSSAASIIRGGELSPDDALPPSRNKRGDDVWAQVLEITSNPSDSRHPSSFAELQNFAALVASIMNTSFSDRENFIKYTFQAAMDGPLEVLEVMLDAGVPLSDTTYSSIIAGRLPSANAVFGFYWYKISTYTSHRQEQIGRIIAKMEKSGGGGIEDFEYGAKRRGEWNQTLRDIAGGAVILAAYAGAKVVGGTIENMKNSWNSAAASGSTEGGSPSTSESAMPTQTGPQKVPCSACSGRGGHSPGYKGFLEFGANFQKCAVCDGTGKVWVR